MPKKEITAKERAQLILDVANGALVEGDGTGALQLLVQVQALDSTLPGLHHSKALAYHLKGDNESAIEEARLAVQLDPKYSDANDTLGKLLMDEGKYDEAIPFLVKSAKDPLYRDAYKPYTNLGILYYRTAKYPKAKEALDRAILSSRERACVAYYYRGHIALQDQRRTDAIHDYKQASAGFCTSFAEAHLALGMAYEGIGKVDEARHVFLDIRDHFPSSEASAKAIEHLRGIQ